MLRDGADEADRLRLLANCGCFGQKGCRFTGRTGKCNCERQSGNDPRGPARARANPSGRGRGTRQGDEPGHRCPRRGCPSWAGCRRQRTCRCCSRWPSAAPSRPTGSSPGSSRSPPLSGSSPRPPPCRDRGGQPPPPPSEPVGDQGHGRPCSHVTHHPARTLPTPG